MQWLPKLGMRLVYGFIALCGALIVFMYGIGSSYMVKNYAEPFVKLLGYTWAVPFAGFVLYLLLQIGSGSRPSSITLLIKRAVASALSCYVFLLTAAYLIAAINVTRNRILFP